jgi:FkbM family methyltransferase
LLLAQLFNFARFISRHSLTRDHQLAAWLRFIRWQIGSRLLKYPLIIPWIGSTKLIIERGMVGATGNFYCGLHEFEDMGFVLHFLRRDDLFLDIGANVGTYTVLAAGVTGSSVMAFEPIPTTHARLLSNLQVNSLNASVVALNIGLGAESGYLVFSADLDSENHVLQTGMQIEGEITRVNVDSLDNVLGGRMPTMIKIDVEGFETEVIRGGALTFNSPSLMAVLIELNGSGQRYGFSEKVIRDSFVDRGFSPYCYDPFKRSLKPIADNCINKNANTLYIRNVKVVQKRLLEGGAFEVLGRSI